MGAHAFAALVRPPPSFSILFRILALLAIACVGRPVSGITEAEALLKFKSLLINNEAIPNWNPSSPPCSKGQKISKWAGVICTNGKVWGLKLDHMGLGGLIDIDALSQLPELRTLSLKNNKFQGGLPDLHRLPKLRSFYLTNNKFSGEIPDNAFAGMDALRRVVLTNNAFTGKIPSSLATLPILVELKLDGNQFQGNKQLCGPPLEPCPGEKPVSSPAPPNTKHKSSSKVAVTVLSVFLALAILALLIVLLLFTCQKRRKAMLQKRDSLASQDENQFFEAYELPPSEEHTKTTTRNRSEPGKLEFVREDKKKFDLSELLTASAEVLESGNFESSYKVELFAGELLVVKRFRQMTKIGREDFNEHVMRMGKLKHPNVLALVAYYYRKEEKLLIFDFLDNGTLASKLHGNHNQKDGGLDWPMRLKIIKGVARGLAYLYNELSSLTVPHGYLKSSNVLLNDSFEPLLMDYALKPLINPEHAKQLMVAYKSPEYAQQGRLTKKTDVWSLGILILEVLTGKFPTNFLAVGNIKGENLVAWVNDIVREEEKGEDVFDKEMGRTQHSKVEMKKLLMAGFSCCHEDVDVRWSIKEA